MAFFNEFPHTRTYDSDLAWLIERMKEVLARMDSVEARMQALEELVANFIDTLDIDEKIKEYLREMLSSGEFLPILIAAIDDYTPQVYDARGLVMSTALGLNVLTATIEVVRLKYIRLRAALKFTNIPQQASYGVFFIDQSNCGLLGFTPETFRAFIDSSYAKYGSLIYTNIAQNLTSVPSILLTGSGGANPYRIQFNLSPNSTSDTTQNKVIDWYLGIA